jgi:hypothetical protein
MKALQTFFRFCKKRRNRQFLRALYNRTMIDFNVFEIYESSKSDFFEIRWLMEAGRVGIGRSPSQISWCW